MPARKKRALTESQRTRRQLAKDKRRYASRRFGGKKYAPLTGSMDVSKAKAQAEAKKGRSMGWNVRVIETSKGKYTPYLRDAV